MPTPEPLLSFVLARLGDLPSLTAAPLLRDAHALYSNSALFALVTPDTVYFKADDQTLTRYLARGARPFRPGPAQSLRGYYSVPPDILHDPAALRAWAAEAIDAFNRHPRRLRPLRRRRRTRKAESSSKNASDGV